MKTIALGVMSQDKIRAKALAIAKGEYKPKPGEPKIWFASMRSVAEVLSDSNRALLKVIEETVSQSMALRREKQQVRPVANATEFKIWATA